MAEVLDDEERDDDNTPFVIKNDLQKAIVDSFTLFSEFDKRNIVAVSDLGKVIRHLGCVPSEKELSEFIENVKDTQNPNIVKLSEFLPYMEGQITALRYRPGTADELLEAFRTLDTKNKGSMSANYVRQALRQGEAFDENEISEVIRTVYDPDLNCIHYDTWIHKLLGKNKMDVYALIPVKLPENRRSE